MIRMTRSRGFEGICLFCGSEYSESSSATSPARSRNCTKEEAMQILANENLDIHAVTRAEVEDVLSQLDLGDSLMSICNTKRDSCYFSKKINALRSKRIRDQINIDDEDERSRKVKYHKSESRSMETDNF